MKITAYFYNTICVRDIELQDIDYSKENEKAIVDKIGYWAGFWSEMIGEHFESYKFVDDHTVLIQVDPLPNNAHLLHYAARGANMILIRALVASGASINVRNNNGTTPLMMMCSEHYMLNKSSLTELIEMGADVNAENIYGETPYHWLGGSDDFDIEFATILLQAGSVEICSKCRARGPPRGCYLRQQTMQRVSH